MDRRPDHDPTATASPSSAKVRRRRWLPVTAGVLALLVIAGGITAAFAFGDDAPGVGAMKFHTVERMNLDVTVRKDGELQAVNSTEVTSKVEGSTTIVELVDEGTFVNAGDLLVRLDSSEIEREAQET